MSASWDKRTHCSASAPKEMASGDGPWSADAFELRRGSSSLDGEVSSRRFLPISWLRRGWLPSIYMRGGAPFEVMEEMEELHHHYKLH